MTTNKHTVFRFKKLIKNIHLCLGLVSGVILFIVALSGCCLSFENELKPLFYPQIYRLKPPQPDSRPLSLDTLVSKARQTSGTKDPVFFVEKSYLKHFPVFIYFGSSKAKGTLMAVHPYTGALLSASLEKDTVFPFLLRLHRYLTMGALGKSITGIAALIFLAALISGLILWWPKKSGRKKAFIIPLKKQTPLARINWSLHSVLGFYIFPVALLIGISGLIFSYGWMKNGVHFLLGGSKPAPPLPAVALRESPPFSYQNIYEKSCACFKDPDKASVRIFPSQKQKITVYYTEYDAPVQRRRSRLNLDSALNITQLRRFSDYSFADKILTLNYGLHTGLILGMPTQILYCIIALVIASLPVSGFIIWVYPKYKKSRRKRTTI